MRKEKAGTKILCCCWCWLLQLQCSIYYYPHLSQYNMVFSGEEGFKGGASAPSLERDVSGMSFSAAIA